LPFLPTSRVEGLLPLGTVVLPTGPPAFGLTFGDVSALPVPAVGAGRGTAVLPTGPPALGLRLGAVSAVPMPLDCAKAGIVMQTMAMPAKKILPFMIASSF
jgi:hypothetical protein